MVSIHTFVTRTGGVWVFAETLFLSLDDELINNPRKELLTHNHLLIGD